ncbi:MAG: hypothetical protein LRY73_03595 [Bacillus sp. (in: Bacteria)]|nr:hypothetical protein [Bacillus sp. (in: firmicutes)]
MEEKIIRPFLITRSLQPENQETPIRFLSNNVPTDLFYLRNHFDYPVLMEKIIF